MSIKSLELKANEIRASVIEMLLEAGSGHSAGPMGMADVFTAMYFDVLKIDENKPNWDQRDRFLVSCGHICPVWYATLAHRGFFPLSKLSTLRKIGSNLQGHPHRGELPGLENTSGPLGQGISQAIGVALAARLNNELWHTFCVASDGELNEGQSWEGIMFAAKEKLHNLTLIVDRNNIQISGFTEDIMPLEPLSDKFKSFNWHVIEINGNEIAEIISACRYAKAVFEKPTVIIAHTTPGKGVDFMEKDYRWHGTPPDKEEANKALRELRTLRGKIISEHE